MTINREMHITHTVKCCTGSNMSHSFIHEFQISSAVKLKALDWKLILIDGSQRPSWLMVGSDRRSERTRIWDWYNQISEQCVAGLLDGWQCKSIQIYQKFLSF